ncbi:MAG: hypothetical protein GC138_07550 [Gammaproteobacteria bacterium]|nr:hypothetical protein [Gammaproteobacteria bacterium]
MNYKTLVVAPILLAGMMFGVTTYAASPAVKEMAGILSHLNHYPSDSEKRSLGNIVKDTNANRAERVIAEAMMQMRHHVNAADRERLEAISRDQGVDKDTRQLAGILASIVHHPSQGDVAALDDMMK